MEETTFEYEEVDDWTEIPPPRNKTLPSIPKSTRIQRNPSKPIAPKPEKLPKPKGKNLFIKEKSKDKHPAPLSERPLPPPPAQRPFKPKVTHSEEIQRLERAISVDEKVENCETQKCQKQYDVVCTKCKQLLCYRCGRGECSRGKKHEIKDFEEYLADHKSLYDLWQTGKKNHSLNLDQEIRALSLAMKNTGQNLANSPLSTVPSCARETIQALMEKLQAVDRMNNELKEVFAVLKYYDTQIANLSDIAFIKLVADMSIADDCRRSKKFNLGTFDTMETRTVEHVTLTPDAGGVLASTSKAVELFTVKSVTSVGQVDLGGHLNGFHSYEGKVYVAVDMNNRGDQISVYDQQFVKIQTWSTDVKVCDLTVNLDKIYLASIESKLHVYSTHGTFLYLITEGVGTRLTSHPLPDIIVVTNHEFDRVCAINGRTNEVLWTSEVEKPWGVAIDEYEAIWVWSEFQQGIAIFDDKGNMKQEIEHPKLTGIGDVNSIAVKNGKLWVAFDGGMHRFQIGYC